MLYLIPLRADGFVKPVNARGVVGDCGCEVDWQLAGRTLGDLRSRTGRGPETCAQRARTFAERKATMGCGLETGAQRGERLETFGPGRGVVWIPAPNEDALSRSERRQ
jgi:hypothetical protein